VTPVYFECDILFGTRLHRKYCDADFAKKFTDC